MREGARVGIYTLPITNLNQPIETLTNSCSIFVSKIEI